MTRSELASAMMIAGRADDIPCGESGLWSVVKVVVDKVGRRAFSEDEAIPVGRYTALTCDTASTLHHPHGETVMADNPVELRKHLAFALAARGSVLVTGLGLGCVVRMLQKNPAVTEITVVERDRNVLDLVWPHMSHDRLELIHADALGFVSFTDRRWNCAWHDVWTDEDAGECSLALQHAKLMINLEAHVEFQGAWAFPKPFRDGLRARRAGKPYERIIRQGARR